MAGLKINLLYQTGTLESHLGRQLLISRFVVLLNKQVLITKEQFSIKGEVIDYILKRSKKRKRSISMRFNRNKQLQINVPFRMNQSFINDFIMSKFRWIKSHEEKLKLQKPHKILHYENGEKHDFMGNQCILNIISAKASEVFLKEDELMVFHRKNSSVENILNNWYKTQALEYLTNRSLMLAEKFNFPKIKSIKVRNMKARWGSCNSRFEITYNTHLIKTSIQSIDYVIIHELCHLIHPNHSSRFYQLQSEINPNWKAQKQILNEFEIT